MIRYIFLLTRFLREIAYRSSFHNQFTIILARDWFLILIYHVFIIMKLLYALTHI